MCSSGRVVELVKVKVYREEGWGSSSSVGLGVVGDLRMGGME